MHILQVSPLEYGVVDPENDQISMGSGVKTDLNDIVSEKNIDTKAKDPATWRDTTIDMSILYRDYTITAGGNLPEWISTTQDRIISLTTEINNVAVGFVNYLAARGKYVTQRTTAGKPAFEEYVTSVNNQDASVMYGWLWEQSGKMVGHTMFVEGYLRALSKTDWSALRILQVFDGWYSGVRYINYDFASYAQFRGTFFVD